MWWCFWSLCGSIKTYYWLVYNKSNDFELDDTTYDEDDPETVINIKPLVGMLNLKKAKHLKEDKFRITANCVAS